MTDYDEPWKEMLDSFLADAIELFLPEVHKCVDWTFPPEDKGQELPKLYPKSQASGRVVDRLYRVQVVPKLKTPDAEDSPSEPKGTWIYLHLEVQNEWAPRFAKRIFTCFYRILDRFEEPVLCIGIVADNSKSWRPSTWEMNTLGCKVSFEYPIVKLSDFKGKEEQLKQSKNPFASVVLAHLAARETHNKPAVRLRYKLDLLRHLYENGFNESQVRKLFQFLDWVMDLPDSLDLEFRDELFRIEEEKKMPYVTSVERIAKAEGKAEGRLEGVIQTLQEVLGLPVSTLTEIESMSESEKRSLVSELRSELSGRKP